MLTTHLNGTHAPAPSVPKPLAGPVASAVTAVIRRAAIIVAGGVPVIRRAGGRPDERADGKAANHAGRDCAAMASFSRLRGGDGREPKGRGGRESSECSGLSHGAPFLWFAESYAFNGPCARSLHIFAQQQQSSSRRGSCFSREWPVNGLFGIG